MALRACVILLFVLLSGSVHGNGTVMTSAPGMQEPSTSQISTVTQTAGTGSPSTSAAPPSTTLTTTGAQTTMAVGFTSELLPTQDQKTTNATTEPPTTTHHNATTEPPTTTHHNATTEPPTTTHHNATTDPPTTTHHNATTAPPTTPHQNTTNSTTEAPTTAHPNVTTAPTPPPTTPPIPKPTVGNYSVRPNVNSSSCLLANMGLQFSFTTIGNASRQTINVDPNETSVSGSCGIGGSDSSLLLKSDKITVRFVFTNVSEKFRLHALELSVDIGQGKFFNESNANLSLWEASVGSSYMCRKEQSYNISDKLTLNTFELQVQPFGVQKNMFSTAHECSMDDISLLIPIIVGAVLAGLIFIVVIAYVIGRRRTYVGYQTL